MTPRLPCIALALGMALTTPAAQAPVFRSFSDAVVLNVRVTDRNRTVQGLTAADFEITDNSVPQAIIDVTHETDPFDVTLVLDTSGSIHRALLDTLVASVNRVRQQLRPQDRISVVTFNQRVREMMALAPAGGRSPIAIAHAYGQTSLNDAIATALVSAPGAERRQMAIVFTDGFDSASFLRDADVVEVARRSQVALFVVAAGDRRALPSVFLETLSDLTGGLVQIARPVGRYTIELDAAGRPTMPQGGRDLLEGGFLRAVEDFRTSYVVRYAPKGVERGGWHEVGVTAKKGSKQFDVRTRRGYTGASPR